MIRPGRRFGEWSRPKAQFLVADVSVILKGSPLDTGPYVPIPKP